MKYSLLPLFKSNNDKHMIITIMTIRDKHFFYTAPIIYLDVLVII